MPLDPRVELVPVSARTDRHGPRKTVTVTGTATHVLEFNLGSGGYLDSWTVDGTEILNRGDCYIRGIQPYATWTDADLGEFTTHQLTMGGDYYSHPSLTGKVPHGGGAPISFTETEDHRGGTRIDIECVPVELDPDGVMGQPGVRTSHGGDSATMVKWRDMRLRMRVWVNWRGNDGVHLITSGWYTPKSLLTAHFDVSLGVNVFLNRNAVLGIKSADGATVSEEELSDGVITNPGYVAEYRRYATNGTVYYGDEEGVIDGNVYAGRNFGIGTDATVSVGLGNNLDDIGSGLDLTLAGEAANTPSGNEFSWSQAGTDATGSHDSESYTMIGHASALTNRWHNVDCLRRVSSGWTENARFMFTGTNWASIKNHIVAMHDNGYRVYEDGP